MKKIIAYSLHETEHDAASTFLRELQVEGAMVTGLIEEQDMTKLKEAGVLFDVVEEKPELPQFDTAEEAMDAVPPESIVQGIAGRKVRGQSPGAETLSLSSEITNTNMPRKKLRRASPALPSAEQPVQPADEGMASHETNQALTLTSEQRRVANA